MVELSGNVIDETLYTTGEVDTNTETLTTTFEECEYKERMMDYYPPVIQAISEFRAIINSECPEFEVQGIERNNIMNDE